MHKYGLKPTGHRDGKFLWLAAILYGDPEANLYSQCCALLQKKKAAQ
jgi:hypothetical protein